MGNKITKILNLFIILLFFCFPTFTKAVEFDITSEYVILYNLNDDTVLYEQNSNEKTSIASLTKIMTSLVAIANIPDLDAYVTITNSDFLGTDGYSKAGFRVGDRVTYRDLLYGILLPSGAEAVNAVVNNTLGSADFIAEMNNLAQEIGLKNTSFSNAIGKDDASNYSTAKDVANLLEYALNIPLFKEIFTTKEYTTTNNIVLESTLYPYQDILDITKIDGSKSGFTKNAGRCLASITTLNDVSYLLVVINASTAQNYSAVLDTITIYDYYNTNYSYQTILDSNDIITTIPIEWSREKEYQVTGLEEVEMFLENGTSEDLNYEFTGLDVIEKGTKKGAKLGTLTITVADEVLYTTDIYLNKDITYYPSLLLIILVLVIFILIIRFLRQKKRRRRKRRR